MWTENTEGQVDLIKADLINLAAIFAVEKMFFSHVFIFSNILVTQVFYWLVYDF